MEKMYYISLLFALTIVSIFFIGGLLFAPVITVVLTVASVLLIGPSKVLHLLQRLFRTVFK